MFHVTTPTRDDELKEQKIKLNPHLNDNIEWHCMELEVNSN